jgi:hypothetical protein
MFELLLAYSYPSWSAKRVALARYLIPVALYIYSRRAIPVKATSKRDGGLRLRPRPLRSAHALPESTASFAASSARAADEPEIGELSSEQVRKRALWMCASLSFLLSLRAPLWWKLIYIATVASILVIA